MEFYVKCVIFRILKWNFLNINAVIMQGSNYQASKGNMYIVLLDETSLLVIDMC